MPPPRAHTGVKKCWQRREGYRVCGNQGRNCLVEVRSLISRKSRNKRRGREEGEGEHTELGGVPGGHTS